MVVLGGFGEGLGRFLGGVWEDLGRIWGEFGEDFEAFTKLLRTIRATYLPGNVPEFWMDFGRILRRFRKLFARI